MRTSDLFPVSERQDFVYQSFLETDTVRSSRNATTEHERHFTKTGNPRMYSHAITSPQNGRTSSHYIALGL